VIAAGIRLPHPCSIRFGRKQNFFWQSRHLAGTMGFSRKQRGYFFLDGAVFQPGKATQAGTDAPRACRDVFVTIRYGLAVTDNQGVATHGSAWGEITRIRASLVNRIYVARLGMGHCSTCHAKAQCTHCNYKQAFHIHRITSFIFHWITF
jgi:hypothetical protein